MNPTWMGLVLMALAAGLWASHIRSAVLWWRRRRVRHLQAALPISPHRINYALDAEALCARVMIEDRADTLGFRRQIIADAQVDAGDRPWYRELKLANGSANATAPSVAAVPTAHTPVVFAEDEPTSFEDYQSQPAIVRYFQQVIRAMRATQLAIGRHIFLGPAGLGKTLLAKIICNELRLRNMEHGASEPAFIEIMGADIDCAETLDALMHRVQQSPGCVLFIDEIHEMQGKHVTKLYQYLAENRYRFADAAAPVEMPEATVLAATTDAGQMPHALLRRFEQWNFERATPLQLTGFLERRRFPITPDAIALIVARTHYSGAPWEGLMLRAQAETFARARKATAITAGDVRDVFTVQGIDDLGLRRVDRSILEALHRCPRYRNGLRDRTTGRCPQEFVCFAESIETMCQLAGVDVAQYRTSIKPRLMSRGLIATRSGYGQSLTGAGIAHLERVTT